MSEANTLFPHAERRELRHPPIELIIAQIRFPTLAELFANDGFVSFAKAMRDEYPNASPESQISIEVSPDRVSEQGRTPVWRFEDLNAEWTLTLAPSFLALETRQYQTFPDFRIRFVEAWSRLVESYQIRFRTRLGLRYVDRFSDDKQSDLPEHWIALIEPSIFPMRMIGEQLPQTGRVEHRVEIAKDLGLTFRSMYKSGPRDLQANREFVLDLDCYDVSRAGVDRVGEKMDVLKEIVHNAFWWTFENLIDQLEPSDGRA